VHASSWQVAYRGLVSDEFLDEIDPQAWAQRYRQRADPQRVTLLARNDGAPVGMVSFGPDRHEPECGEIYTIYVLPSRQNQGIGKQLMSAAITRLDRDVVHLWCAEGNVASQAFYESVGFTADGGRGTFAVAGVTLPTLRFTAGRGRT
jgi:GNAT superfamily N-acetyltransferase